MPIKDLYQSGHPVVSVEVFPPKKDSEIESIYGAINQMSDLAPDFISVTYGASGGGNKGRTVELASHIQRRLNTNALAHLTCIGAGKETVRQALSDMSVSGISNVLALRGDLPQDDAPGGDFQFAEELIRFCRECGDFCIGAACYPEGHIDCPDTDTDIAYLRRKQEAGADFLITQLFFDNDIFFRFLDKAEKNGITVPVSAGVMPILGRGQIERMVFMCGVSLPAEIVKLLHRYEKSPDDLRRAGIEYAAAQVEDLIKRGAQGVHIYSMNKPDIALSCMKRIGRAN